MLTWQINYLGQVCNIRLHSDYLHLVLDMDSKPKESDTQSDSASDISTEIILGTTQSSQKQTVVQNKLSITKDHIKIELESKTQICSSGNLLCASSFNQPWLDLVKDLISK